MKNLDPARARWIRLRMGILCGFMGLGLGVVVSTAYRVQIEDGKAWRDMAERQRIRRLHVEPKRGTIVDRNGTQLAVSVEVPSLSADVVEMLRLVPGKAAQDVYLREVARLLAPKLSLAEDELFQKLSNRGRFVWIKRRLSAEEAGFVRELSDVRRNPRAVRGLTIDGEGQRFYPGRGIAGPLLGFVAPDGQGKDGIELSLDEELRGRIEEIRGLRDRNGRLIFSEGTTDEGALQGRDVQLSIDTAIQHIAERELDITRRMHETRGASIVVMDPTTGDILAMASSPGYNPNDYGESDVDSRRDRAVSDRFEPGSTMKAFTVAAALAAGTLKPSDIIDCERGQLKLAARVTIHDTHVNENLSVTQVLAKSSNIGALKIGLKLGESGLYSAFRRFGFGEASGLPVPGEASGVLRPLGRPWVEVETATASFGQGISVTNVQLAFATAALANGGKLMEPILVKRITDPRGRVIREAVPRVRREVIPPAVARTVSEMLVAVTEPGGTGVEAAVPGFRVAGKTATAQKLDPATGKVSQDKYVASFAGFVPADRPRLVISVVFDEPAVGRYGGDIAGPVFRRVAEASLRYLGVTPGSVSAKVKSVSRDDDPADKTILATRPASSQAEPVAQTPQGPLSAGQVRVPELAGMAARDGIRALTAAGLLPTIEGSGRVARQYPAAGSAAQRGSSVRLVLEPPS